MNEHRELVPASVRDGKALRTIEHFYSCMDHPEHPPPTVLQTRNQSHKVCEKTSWRSFILRRVNKDSGLPSPYFFHHKKKKKKKGGRGRQPRGGQVGRKGWKGSGSRNLVARKTQHERD